MAPSTGLTSSIASRIQSYVPRTITSCNVLNVLFGLYVIAIAAQTSCAVYNFYKAYQARYNPPLGLGLDDEMKLTKCWALLTQAKRKSGDQIESYWAQSKKLITAVRSNIWHFEKDVLLRKWATLYAKDRPARAYKIAKRLSNPSDQLQILCTIHKDHPDFDLTQLDELFPKAPDLSASLISPTFNIFEYLRLAKSFHSLNREQLAIQCLQKAASIAQGSERGKELLTHLCMIAEGRCSIGKTDEALAIAKAAALEMDQITDRDQRISAQLRLAHAFSTAQALGEMNEKLQAVLQELQNLDASQKTSHLYSLASLIVKKGTPKDIEKLKKLVDNIANPLLLSQSLTAEQIDTVFDVARIYGKECLNNKQMLERLLTAAERGIVAMPEKTAANILDKVDKLIRLAEYPKQFPDKANNSLKQLEVLYERVPADRPDRPADRSFCWDKSSLGEWIMSTYTAMGLELKSTEFFSTYLDSFNRKGSVEKIESLTKAAALPIFRGYRDLTSGQRRTLVQTAEMELPQVINPQDRKKAVKQLLNAYAHIDGVKAQELLASIEKEELRAVAKRHLIKGIVATTLLAVGGGSCVRTISYNSPACTFVII